MALPRTQTEACQQIARDFAPQGWRWTNRPGILHPEVGAGQNVPEFCKAGIRLNKIMGKIVMGQKRSQKCKDIKITWQFRLVSFHLS